MTTHYEFLVPTSCICMYKNIRVWRLWAPGGRGPVCLAHSAHPIATPLKICIVHIVRYNSYFAFITLRYAYLQSVDCGN